MDKKQREKTRKCLEKEIKWLEKEKKKINGRIQKRYDVIHELETPRERFECPKGLSLDEAICTTCENAMPSFFQIYKNGKTTYEFQFPDGSTKKEYAFKENDEHYCKKWQEKHWGDFCGCGGTYTCVCGFKQTFCFLEEDFKCPYCDRKCKTSLSQLILSTHTTKKPIPLNTIKLTKEK